MANFHIPFNRPALVGNEQEYLRQSIAERKLSGDGPFTKKCHELLEELLSARKVLLTTSCTHALEMAALLMEIVPGDEVIVPAFTFVSTVNAFVLRGAKPVFADIRRDTLNLDEKALPKLITSRTRAIVPVHYAGVACAMEPIMNIAREQHISVIEDNAHGLFGRYRGRLLGSFGAMSTLSFHETKNFTCGEGGALIINDETYVQRAEIIREKGTNRSRFFRGQVDKYTWVDVGSSYLPSDTLAAFLLAQLEAREQIQTKRQQIWQTYYDQLKDWAAANDVQLPVVPEDCEQAYHMFYMLLPDHDSQQRVIAHLKSREVSSVFHYLPLNLSDMGRRFGGFDGQCPVTEDVSHRLIRLPFYFDLTPDLQAVVIDAVLSSL